MKDAKLNDVYATVHSAINSAMREVDMQTADFTLRDILTEAAFCIAHWAENLDFEDIMKDAKTQTLN